jgi:hypothetical protein
MATTTTTYEVGDEDLNIPGTLGAWAFLADGKRFGRIEETQRGYRAVQEGARPDLILWAGPEWPFRVNAIEEACERHKEATRRRTAMDQETAASLKERTSSALADLDQWREENPRVADWRAEEARRLLSRATTLLGYLHDDRDPEGDAARAKLRESGFFDQD